ncbi:MAG TPA: PEP-utilizing enzyme [Acidimicrobiia bacterium]|nr:PEP-utilizing enzyme [Acidimicrobiia bacterium]
MTDDEITFAAPGPGQWELDATHRGRRPISPFLRERFLRDGSAGFTALAEGYGLPLAEIRAELVHGCLYFRPIGIGEGDTPKPPPPAWIMKLLVRVHPELRRRNKAAARAWSERRWRHEVDHWFDRERATVVERNLEHQRVEVGALDDRALVDHVGVLLDHFGTQARRNMETHGGDLIPAGDFLAHCRRWGIADAEATALLRGSSPASVETASLLAPVAKAVADAGSAPDSIDAVRALGDDARAAVDAWVERHAWRLVTTDDIDKPTLAERPNLQLAALLAAVDAPGDPTPPDAEPTRAKVPVTERATFDALLAEARYGMRQRDDSVGVRWNWSGGLLRRALLEAGRRLVARGALERAEHVVELAADELGPLLLDGTGPDAAAVAARAAWRDRVEAARAPDTLGDPEQPPPLDVFPAPLARATAALLAVLEAEGLSATPSGDGISGTGIGTTTYRGVARVATSADDALDRLEPGDVLVAPFTGPAYNSILPMLGALVVDAGGTMCHAAIVAREFALPAVVGATGATTHIPDGALVEVDPVAGRVAVVG